MELPVSTGCIINEFAVFGIRRRLDLLHCPPALSFASCLVQALRLVTHSENSLVASTGSEKESTVCQSC